MLVAPRARGRDRARRRAGLDALPGRRRAALRTREALPAGQERRRGGHDRRPARAAAREAVKRELPRPSSRIVHGSTVSTTRCVPLHGSRASVARTSSWDAASTASTTRRSSASGPPRTTKPSSTSPFMKSLCSGQPDCSSIGRDGSQRGPMRRSTTKNMDAPVYAMWAGAASVDGTARSSLRSTRKVATNETSAKPAPTQNAMPKPSVSACGRRDAVLQQVLRARRRHGDQDREAERSADLLRGVDEPRREACLVARRSPARAAIETGTNEKPIPTPIRMKPGSRSPRYEPPTETCVKRTSPTVSIARPAASTGAHAEPRHERLRDPDGDDREERDGRDTRSPSSAASSRAPAACRARAGRTSRRWSCPSAEADDVGPVGVRRRKNPSGTSGERERVSITRKAAISSAEPARAPIVCHEPQP